ncbi:hypothetical protein F4604DRAFT_1676381 [Suillus subluteus]|nr:hypothetical protein F4604DRAFT_1676381 [Suillus subluteus]
MAMSRSPVELRDREGPLSHEAQEGTNPGSRSAGEGHHSNATCWMWSMDILKAFAEKIWTTLRIVASVIVAGQTWSSAWDVFKRWRHYALGLAPLAWGAQYIVGGILSVVFNGLVICIMPFLVVEDAGIVAEESRDSTAAVWIVTSVNIVRLVLNIPVIRSGQLPLALKHVFGMIAANLFVALGLPSIVSSMRGNSQEIDYDEVTLIALLVLCAIVSIGLPMYVTPQTGDKASLLLEISWQQVVAVSVIVVYIAFLIYQGWNRNGQTIDDDGERRPLLQGGELQLTGGAPSAPASRTGSPMPANSGHLPATLRSSLESAMSEPRGRKRRAAVFVAIEAAAASYSAQCFVDSLKGILQFSTPGPAWLELVVLPIIADTVVIMTALAMAYRKQFYFTLILTFNAALQVAAFSLPAVLLLAWVFGKNSGEGFDMTIVKMLMVCAAFAPSLYSVRKASALKGLVMLLCIFAITFIALGEKVQW